MFSTSLLVSLQEVTVLHDIVGVFSKQILSGLNFTTVVFNQDMDVQDAFAFASPARSLQGHAVAFQECFKCNHLLPCLTKQ